MNPSSSARRDCAGIAPQLTALFDGEADAEQAQHARAHLLSCPACSQLWLDWTQHRATLQSEPVPAPPPTLLWRVLIAYRVAAFARPARRRSRLPVVSATQPLAHLRALEAPIPPRLSQHILAHTTRKPSAHVLLTPLEGPPRRAHWQNRASKFRRVSLLAAPALALWVLMLARTDFDASLPTLTPASPAITAPATVASVAEKGENAVNPGAPQSVAIEVELDERFVATSAASSSPREDDAAPLAPVALRVRARASRAASAPRFNRAPDRAPDARADATLQRSLLVAMSAGRRDLARAQTLGNASNQASPTPVTTSFTRSVAARSAAVTPPSVPLAPAPITQAPARTQPPVRVTRPAPVETPARVTLAALAAPISPIRTVSAARLRTAAFSEDSMRPRVSHASASGRRLARLMPDENGETPLRISRPIAGAPTLREANFNGDKGPRIEDLRSAVDDFRASVSGDE